MAQYHRHEDLVVVDLEVVDAGAGDGLGVGGEVGDAGARHLEAAVRRLRSLPGISDWTAQYIALRALREPDAFPADAGLLSAMANTLGHRPTSAELLARAETWRPWRAYAAMHLWAAVGIPVRSIHQGRNEERRVA